MRNRLTAITAFLAVALAWNAATFAGDAAAPAAKPAARPAGVPAQAAAWLVVPAPKTGFEHLKKLIDQFQPGFGPMAEMVIRQSSPWAFAEADETKPVIAIVNLPAKKGDKPNWAAAGSLKAGTNAAAALEGRFGGKASKVEDGVSVFAQVQEGNLPDKEIFAVAKDGRAVIGDSKELVKALAAAATPAADAYPAGLDVLVGIDVKIAGAQYKAEIEEGLKNLEEMGGVEVAGGDADAMKQMALMAKGAASMVRKALTEAEVVTLQLKLGDTVSIGWSARAAAGTEFAGWLAKAEKVQLPSAGDLPEGGMASVVTALPVDVMGEFTKSMLKLVYDGLAKDEKGKKSLEEFYAATDAMLKNTDGKMSAAVSRRAGGLTFFASAGTKDQAAARANLARYMKSIETGPVADEMAKSGSKSEFKEKVRESAGLPVDRVTISLDPAKAKLDEQAQEQMKKAFDKMFGLPMIEDVACAKDRMVVATGKEAAAALDEILARATGAKPATNAMAGTLKAAPKGTFVAGEVYVLQFAAFMADLLKDTMGEMIPMPKLDLPKDAETTPWTMYMAAADGELSAELRIPVAPIKKLVDELKKAQGAVLEAPVDPVPLP